MAGFVTEAYKRGKIDFPIDYNQPDRIAELLTGELTVVLGSRLDRPATVNEGSPIADNAATGDGFPL